MSSIVDLTPDMTRLFEAVFISVGFVTLVNVLMNGLAHWIAHRLWED